MLEQKADVNDELKTKSALVILSENVPCYRITRENRSHSVLNDAFACDARLSIIFSAAEHYNNIKSAYLYVQLTNQLQHRILMYMLHVDTIFE